ATPSPPCSASGTSLSLNLRLIVMVVALLAVTIGGIAVFSTRVVHTEIRKIMINGVRSERIEHAELPPLPRRALDPKLLLSFSGAALFGMAMAVVMARWVTVPIERLTEATRRMERGDLSVRVEPAGGPELGALAHGFNAMAEAIHRNEELRRRMVTDVAHELR